MATIQNIHAYEVIDSKGIPTIEAVLRLDSEKEVIVSVPSVPKTDTVTAELRDEDQSRFDGLGVLHAVSYINDLIAPKLQNVSVDKQFDIDSWLIAADGTKNKSKLGANTILTISELVLKAGALSAGIPLFRYISELYKMRYKDEILIEKIPTPIFNMINGGRQASNSIEFQEFQLIPSSSLTFAVAYQRSVEMYYELRKVLEYRNATTGVGEEGGFSPNLSTNLDVLEILNETISQRKLKIGLDIFLGIDMAANYFCKNNLYSIKDKTHPLKREEYIEFIKHLTTNYSLLSFEDPFSSDDWESWKKLNQMIAANTYLIGDELIQTNKTKLEYAIRENAITTFAIKPNQVGTIMELFDVVNVARTNNISYIVSARSSETNDTFIADLAVGLQAEFVKFGAPVRGERVSKYNRLWQIERDELNKA